MCTYIHVLDPALGTTHISNIIILCMCVALCVIVTVSIFTLEQSKKVAETLTVSSSDTWVLGQNNFNIIYYSFTWSYILASIKIIEYLMNNYMFQLGMVVRLRNIFHERIIIHQFTCL